MAAGAFVEAFPGEHDLVAEYRVSRHTVREAVRRLREDGVIESGRGRPTTVRAGIEQPLGSLYSLFREVEARGMVQTSVVLAQRQVRDAAAAAALGLPDDEPLFHLARVRLADDVPLAHDRVWLPMTIAAPLLDADFGRSALYDELAARTGVRLTGGRERITATVPGPADRELLQVPRGVACLSVERTGLVANRAVEHRLTMVRGDRWAVVADWSGRGYSVGAVAES